MSDKVIVMILATVICTVAMIVYKSEALQIVSLCVGGLFALVNGDNIGGLNVKKKSNPSDPADPTT